jgi:hypothetical protein
MCTCGPLGYAAAISDPDTGEFVSSPLLETAEEARAWRREQEWAVDPQRAAASNGNGNGGGSSRVTRTSTSRTRAIPATIERSGLGDDEPTGRASSRDGTRHSQEAPPRRAVEDSREPAPPRRRAVDDAREATAPRRAVEESREPPARRRRPVDDVREAADPRRAVDDPSEATATPRRAAEIPPNPIDERGSTVSTLIDRFLDAAEDGEARGRDGRPYTDDELAELEWALAGYVDSHIGHLDASRVRGRHIFQLVDELEDADMPRPRLLSVVDAVRELFGYAADRDLVRVNPAEYISMPADELEPQPRRQPRVQETLETGVERPTPRGAPFDNFVSEQTIWMLVKIVALVFVCIALVLVAESV